MSSFSKLLEDITSLSQFPIEIGFIDDWLKQNGFQDEINFIPVNINPQKATAYSKRRSGIALPYAERPWIYDVVYSSNMNECWQRFLCCKELMHLFDKEDERAQSADAVGQLIGEIVSTGLGDLDKKDTLAKPTIADLSGYNKALITLVPSHIVDALRPAYESGEKSDNQIALFLKIPEVFIDRIFSEEHAQLYTNYKHELTIVENTTQTAIKP